MKTIVFYNGNVLLLIELLEDLTVRNLNSYNDQTIKLIDVLLKEVSFF